MWPLLAWVRKCVAEPELSALAVPDPAFGFAERVHRGCWPAAQQKALSGLPPDT